MDTYAIIQQMNHSFRFVLKILLISFLSLSVLASNNQDESIPEILVNVGVQSFAHQNKSYLAVNFQNAAHWHTYWKNPGDAGLPLKNKFTVNGQEIVFKQLHWPAPKKFIEDGGIIAYGYENDYSLFYEVDPETHQSLLNKTVELHATWLICKHICIPGEIQVRGVWHENGWNAQTPLELSRDELISRLQQLPAETKWPTELDINLYKINDESLVLYYNYTGPTEKFSHKRNLLTPFRQSLLGFKGEKLRKDAKSYFYGRMEIDWDGIYEEPAVKLPSNSTFAPPLPMMFLFENPSTGEVSIISKNISDFAAESQGVKSFFLSLTSFDESDSNAFNPKVPQKSFTSPSSVGLQKPSLSIWFYFLFAFVGGLILNIMPCVLPVISLKLFGLLQHSQESKRSIIKHNLLYTLGVLATFSLLAFVIIVLKSSGEVIGWGFQLQSPRFILVMIFVLFLMGLNLFGLFEFRTPFGKSLGNIELKDGPFGDLFSGVLATILSTPCSAPFLGTALTFAFSSSPFVIFLIFFMIGLGLSFPFILTALLPQAIQWLPQPGAWMEHVKKFLGLTLFLTIIWLLDVYSALVLSSHHVMKLLTALLLTFFLVYMRSKMSKRPLYSFLVFFIILGLSYELFLPSTSVQSSTSLKDQEGMTPLIRDKRRQMNLNWLPWSPEKMQELRGETLFIDFTAKWCLTCKVNEKLVFDTDGFRSLVQEKNVTLLMADWTYYDKTIGSWLKEHGFVGVPAYFIQKPDGELITLGETTSLKELREKL